VPSAPTDAANDVGGVVALFRAVVFAMANPAAVLADLVFVITKSTVQDCELAKLKNMCMLDVVIFKETCGDTDLVEFVVVLAFRGGGSLNKGKKVSSTRQRENCALKTYCLYNLVDKLNASSNLLFSVSKDKAMKIFFSIIGELVRSSFPLFDTSLSSNADLRTAVSLHFLQAIATGTDK
jgi:hypothetical protein